MKRACIALFVVACAGAEPKAVAPEPALGWRALEARDSERERAERIDAWLGGTLGFYGDHRVVSYVDSVGQRLVSLAGSEASFSFRVLDDPAVNAFAAPGGAVYVTRGMLAHLSTEAELAAVLAHEIAHVERGHHVREDVWEEQRALTWTPADAVRFYERSRDNEREADRVAVQLCTRAGYDPRALSFALRRLDAYERAHEPKDREEDGWLSSHPESRARIARAEWVAAGRGRAGARPDRHLSAIDGMTFGENPRRGFLVGRTYVMPTHGLAFDLPPAWRAKVSACALSATAADGSAYLLLLRWGHDGSPFAEGSELEATRIAGRPAHFGRVELDDRREGRIGVVDLETELLVMIAATSDDAFELDGVPARFRPVTEAGWLSVQPARLWVVPAREGQRLADSELALLNGVSPGRSLSAGRLLKLPSER